MATAARTGLYLSHPSSLEHDPRELMPAHPDIPERLLAIERVLGAEDWLGWERRAAPAARRALELDPQPLSRSSGSDAWRRAAAARSIPTRRSAWPPTTPLCTLRAAPARWPGRCSRGESTLGFCGLRPPGHHAEADRAMGFCLFNNVAVAAELAIRELGARRVFILDWDVHHGNGTAEAFRARADVLYASIHQDDFYPGTGPLQDAGSGEGEGFTINLPVPAGSGEKLWLVARRARRAAGGTRVRARPRADLGGL